MGRMSNLEVTPYVSLWYKYGSYADSHTWDVCQIWKLRRTYMGLRTRSGKLTQHIAFYR